MDPSVQTSSDESVRVTPCPKALKDGEVVQDDSLKSAGAGRPGDDHATQTDDSIVTKAEQDEVVQAVQEIMDASSASPAVMDERPLWIDASVVDPIKEGRENEAVADEGADHTEGDSDQDDRADPSVENNLSDKAKALVAKVKKLDFEHFKIRYSKEDGRSMIEVLEAGSNLKQEVKRLHAIHARFDKMKTTEQRERLLSRIPPLPTSGKLEQKWIQRVRIQSPTILYHLAKSAEEDWGITTPTTFMRPFKVLIYFQPRMKEILAKLETRWKGKDDETQKGARIYIGSDLDPTAAAVAGGTAQDRPGPDDIAAGDDEFANRIEEAPERYSLVALQAMRCYVRFVDKEIMPLNTLFTQPDPPRTKVRFTDLWFLFKPGELVYAGHNSDVRPKRGQSGNLVSALTQSTLVWRVYTINCPPEVPSYPSFTVSRKPRSLSESETNRVESSNTKSSFFVFAYYVDWDGVSYGPVKHCFTIAPYDGEIDIRLLPCYPIRYAEDPHLLATLKEEGVKFKDCIEKKHLSYEGWTASTMPDGEQITMDPEGSRVRYPEFVESHVIVDSVEAFQVFPFWKPQFHNPPAYGDDDEWSHCEDQYCILDWDQDRRVKELVQSDDGITMWQRKDYFETKGSIIAYQTHVDSGKTDKEKKSLELMEEDYVLLPKLLFAYVLRDRKFVPLDIRFLQPIQTQQNVFDRLQIPSEYKRIVKGLVASHFVRKDLERNFSSMSAAEKSELMQKSATYLTKGQVEDTSSTAGSPSTLSTQALTQDLIQGKGRGLVILLHGVPGVGKTATAEAVAMEYQKPLFVITCGDLGLTPSDVERHLNEVFRLAHLWNCVLLLDEADVFLASRTNLDLNRNALVSVFLRVLEYYSGVLFLTTNRVGTLDEAFKSRIHVSLYYPELLKKQAQLIFEINIARLEEIAKTRSLITGEPKLEIDSQSILGFASDLFDRRSNHERVWIPWNGRQIRNAFQIASSLAYNDYEIHKAETASGRHTDMKNHSPVLNRSHFNVISKVTDEFDDYMLETRGRSDKDRASMFGERADRRKAEQKLGLDRIGSDATAAANTPTYSRRHKSERPRTPENMSHHGYATPGSRSGPMRYSEGSSYGAEQRHPPSDSLGGANSNQSGLPPARHSYNQEYSDFPERMEQPPRSNNLPPMGRRRDEYHQDAYSTNAEYSHQDRQSRGYQSTPPHGPSPPLDQGRYGRSEGFVNSMRYQETHGSSARPEDEYDGDF